MRRDVSRAFFSFFFFFFFAKIVFFFFSLSHNLIDMDV